MPILNPIIEPAEIANPINVLSTPPLYRGVTVDTRYVAVSNLLSYMEGSSWVGNYYSQVVDADNALAGENLNLDPIYQQYKLIKDFELKVITPLSQSQDVESNTMVLTGAAHVYPFLIPNVGDMFLADVGDGREGIFRITTSERKTIFKDTVHLIEYQLTDYSTLERRTDLNAKVVSTLRFVKDFISYGQNPLLQEEEYVAVQDLLSLYTDLLQSYMKSFSSGEFKTLLVPGQTNAVYDHFLTQTIKHIFTTFEANELRYTRVLNCDGDDNMNVSQLWTALIERDKKILRVCSKRVGLISTRTFELNPVFEGIRYSGIPYTVYFKDPELSLDYQRTGRIRTVSGTATLLPQPSTVVPLEDLLTLIEPIDKIDFPYGDAPFLKAVTVDDYYVFSQAFYANAEGQSMLELAVRDYLDGKALNNQLLLALGNTYYAWGGLERFYYLPILLILIKATIRRM